MFVFIQEPQTREFFQEDVAAILCFGCIMSCYAAIP